MDLALVLGGAFLVIVWGFFTFFATPGLPFVYEDFPNIVDNSALHGITTISEGWSAAIRPLTALSFAFDWKIGSGNPGFFHFTNALIHILNAMLLFLLCRRVYDPKRFSEVVCMAPALLFLVHPTFSTPALYIFERSVLLGSFFALLTVLAYLGRRDRSLAVSLVFFALGWSAHATVWALPFVLVVSDVAVGRPVQW
jgi:hypothetical protein